MAQQQQQQQQQRQKQTIAPSQEWHHSEELHISVSNYTYSSSSFVKVRTNNKTFGGSEASLFCFCLVVSCPLLTYIYIFLAFLVSNAGCDLASWDSLHLHDLPRGPAGIPDSAIHGTLCPTGSVRQPIAAAAQRQSFWGIWTERHMITIAPVHKTRTMSTCKVTKGPSRHWGVRPASS